MFPQNPLVTAAVRSLWDMTARIFTYERVRDEDTGTSYMEETELEGGPFPCRIDVENAPEAEDAEGPDSVAQTITLLIGPEVSIPAGARILITPAAWDGRPEKAYKNAGIAAVYPAHQEIRLIPEDERP